MQDTTTVTPADYQSRLNIKYAPSSYQCAIFDWILTGRGNAVVEAVAGSGKTTTIVLAARLLTVPGLFCAFNNSVAGELKARLVGTTMGAATVHSTGLGSIRFAQPRGTRVEVEKYKYWDRMDAWTADLRADKPTVFGTLSADERSALASDTGKLTLPSATIARVFDLARLNLVDFEGPEYPTVLWDLVNHHGLDVPPGLDRIVAVACVELAKYGRATTTVVDFADMVWLPVVNNYKPKTYSWVFVDECQDISACHLTLLRKCVKRGGRMLFVGDRCQPAGTMVATPTGNVPIETLKEGDLVVSCDMRSSSFIQNGKKVLGVTSRPFHGDLIQVTSAGKTSRYTPNHRCVVRFSGVRTKWCVYLQRRGGQYRIGKSAMDYTHSSGPVSRARCEGADALWILRLYSTEQEAWEGEAVLSGRFGIPQTRFTDLMDSTIMSQEALDRVWAQIGDNRARAIDLLNHVGQDDRWPLFDFHGPEHSLSGEGHQASLKRPIITRACTLLDGVEMLHYAERGHYSAKQWQPCVVTRTPYRGLVYSMDVEKYEMYVADGLLTHNCQAIYGFAGADAQSFQNIVAATKATVLPLSVCYRCPTKVLDIAREYCPQIEARPDAPEGSIVGMAYENLVGAVAEGDMILCRRNAPLVSLCFTLIAGGIAATIKGRDIGQGLQKAIDAIAKLGAYENFAVNLKAWHAKEESAVVRRGGRQSAVEAKLQALEDKVECIRILFSRSDAATYAGLKDDVAALFSDERTSVTLSSIHRAKGLENPRVFVLGPTELSFPGMQAWQREQERNLSYVATTRAQETLVYVPEPGRND